MGGQIGDWFVLYQLSKNCNPYFYREFIRELARDLRTKPKKSQSSDGRLKKEIEISKDVELGEQDYDDSDSSSSDSEEGSNKALIFEKEKEKSAGKNTNTLSKKGNSKQKKGRKGGKRKDG